jgi:AraC family transcriptional regulator of adaptative response / methylphosphotriester-DNA alkyltransferase methyltransferase
MFLWFELNALIWEEKHGQACYNNRKGVERLVLRSGGGDLTRAEMWRAVTENDASYDGVFFYAVKSTKVFCRPSCRSKAPSPENVCYFDSAARALAAGYRPCKRCRSDLKDYQPLIEIAERAKRRMDDSLREGDAPDALEPHPNLTRRTAEVFKETFGVTPRAYVKALRLQEAARRLTETDEAIADIAFAIGFESLSTFYRFFKRGAGFSPAAYRRDRRK